MGLCRDMLYQFVKKVNLGGGAYIKITINTTTTSLI